MNILAADIGGTNARFACFELRDHELRSKTQRTYASGEMASVEEALGRFLGVIDEGIDRAALAVAGPVFDGAGRLTNLGWRVCESDLAEWVGTDDVRVMNDFAALAHVVPFLGGDDVTVVQAGANHASGVAAVLGAGTGLGQALVFPRASGSGVTVHPTEGGHAGFAPRTEGEWALRSFLAERHGSHVSWERVLSGAGLRAAYDYVIGPGNLTEDPTTRAAMRNSDPAAVIVERALADADPACVWALDSFAALFGARAGDVALSVGATAGVYLAGGVTFRIREKLKEGAFLDAFLGKGRMAEWLRRVPVKVITRDDAGMLGAVVATTGSDVLRLPPRANAG
ncbi:MAG: glucokinase [Gemmatimonadota bacterium]|nr:glucokinase [Gemmatimonadota bacterium]